MDRVSSARVDRAQKTRPARKDIDTTRCHLARSQTRATSRRRDAAFVRAMANDDDDDDDDDDETLFVVRPRGRPRAPPRLASRAAGVVPRSLPRRRLKRDARAAPSRC